MPSKDGNEIDVTATECENAAGERCVYTDFCNGEIYCTHYECFLAVEGYPVMRTDRCKKEFI